MRKKNCISKRLFVILGFVLLINHSRAADKQTTIAMEALVSTIQTPLIPNHTLDLCAFSGHQADEGGTYDFVNDIARAIDSLVALGGGTLLFPHSLGAEAWVKQTEIFKIKGPIVLKSNIELKLQPNTKLFFDFDPASYLPQKKPVLSRYEGTSLYTYSPLIYAFNCSNTAISATGGNGAMPVIDGNGERWQKWSVQGDAHIKNARLTPAYQLLRDSLNAKDIPIANRILADTNIHFLRPPLMQFLHSKRIKIEGVKLANSPFWVIHPVFSTDITVRNVMFDCQVVNNDGIDIESSQRVLIENVNFDNHDDNVVIKSGRDRDGREGALVAGTAYERINSPYLKNGRITAATSEVVVRNCSFKGHYAFCIGSEIAGGAHDLYVADCYSPMEVMMGVYFKSSRKRGGLVKNIVVDNVNFQQIRYDAICLIPNYDNDTVSPYPTHFENINIKNMKVKSTGKGIRIFGWEDAPIKNVVLKNIQMETVKSNAKDDILLINQAQKIQLKNVILNKKRYNGLVNKVEKGAIPPKQI